MKGGEVVAIFGCVDVVQAIRDMTGGRGANVRVDAAGFEQPTGPI